MSTNEKYHKSHLTFSIGQELQNSFTIILLCYQYQILLDEVDRHYHKYFWSIQMELLGYLSSDLFLLISIFVADIEKYNIFLFLLKAIESRI